MKKIFALVYFIAISLAAFPVFAQVTFEKNLFPITTDTYDLGSTTPNKEWLNLFVKNIHVSGTCTGCGGGGGGGGTGSVSTSTHEVQDQLAIFDSNSATPALVRGDSLLTFTPSGADRDFYVGDSTFTDGVFQIEHRNSGSLSALYMQSKGDGGDITINTADYDHFGTYMILEDNSWGSAMKFGQDAITGTGEIYVRSASTTGGGILNFSALSGGDKTFTFPNQSGILCIVGVLCDGSGSGSGIATTSLAATYPVTKTLSAAAVTFGFNGLATTSPWNTGEVAYVSDGNHVTSVATGTVSAGSSAITVTAGRSVIGGALSINCATASGSQNGCLSSGDWTTFNNKSGFAYPWTFNTLNTFSTSTNSTSTSYWTQGVYFSSSTVAASQFPYASSTALSAQNLFLSGGVGVNVSPSSNDPFDAFYTDNGTHNITLWDNNGGTVVRNSYIASVSTGASLFTTYGALQVNSSNNSSSNFDVIPSATTIRSVGLSGGIVLVSDTAAPIIFAPNTNDKTLEAGRFTSTGNFGLSTTTPAAKLGVQGNMFIAGNITSTSTTASIFPYASTTAVTMVTGSTTNLIVSSAGGSGSRCLQAAADGTVSATASGCAGSFAYPWTYNLLNTFSTSTNSTSTSYWTQGVYFSSSTVAASQFPYASTTAVTMVTGSTTNLIVSSAGGSGSRCLQAAADGTVSATASGCAGSFAYPWTYNLLNTFSTSTNSTSTSYWTQGVYFSSSTVAASQFPYASTTAVTMVTGSTTNLIVSSAGGSGSRCLQAAADGTVSATASGCAGSFAYPWTYNLLNTFSTSTNSTSTSYWTQGVYFSSSTVAASQFPYASTTALTMVTGSTTNLIVSSAGGTGTRCAQFAADGTISAAAAACGTGGGISWMFGSLNDFGTTTISTTTSIYTVGVFFSSSTALASQFPYASSTGISTNYASSTLYFGAGLDAGCNGTSFLQFSAGRFGCGTPSGGSGTFSFTPAVYKGQQVNSTSTGMLFTGSTYSVLASTTLISNYLQIGDADNSGNPIVTGTLLQISSSTNNFIQATMHNTSTGNNASSNWITCNDKTTNCTTYYGEMGINGSGYSQASQSAENGGDMYLTASDGAIVVGTASSTNTLADIRFTTGGLASSSIRAMISAAGAFSVGSVNSFTSTLMSVVSNSFSHLFSVGTSTSANPLFDVSATSTGSKDWARVAVGTSSTSGVGQFFPFTVQGAISSTKRYIKCEIPTNVGNFTGDVTRACEGIFDIDTRTNGNGAVGKENNGVQFINMFAGTTATAAGSCPAAAGVAMIPTNGGGSGAFTSASSSPIFEAYIDAQSVNATSTAFAAGFISASNGANYDLTTLSDGYYFAATSTNNWIAIAKDSAAIKGWADTGVASSSGNSTYQKVRVMVSIDLSGSVNANYYINDILVAQFTGIKQTSSFFTPMNPVISVSCYTNAGNTKSMKVSYLRAWSDLIPSQGN
jgi:hypothetical protein